MAILPIMLAGFLLGMAFPRVRGLMLIIMVGAWLAIVTEGPWLSAVTLFAISVASLFLAHRAPILALWREGIRFAGWLMFGIWAVFTMLHGISATWPLLLPVTALLGITELGRQLEMRGYVRADRKARGPAVDHS